MKWLLLIVLLWAVAACAHVFAYTTPDDSKRAGNEFTWEFQPYRVGNVQFDKLNVVVTPASKRYFSVTGAFIYEEDGGSLTGYPVTGSCYKSVPGYFCTLIASFGNYIIQVNPDMSGLIGVSATGYDATSVRVLDPY